MDDDAHRVDALGWRGEPVRATRSPGGVLLLADYRDALLTFDFASWPPPPLVTRLVADDEQSRKWPADVQAVASEHLGFYCRLQSINSEDAMTWSVFGPLAYGDEARRVELLHWLCGRADLGSDDTTCTVDLWRTIAHPQKPSASNGPELDAVLEGDRTVVFVECKWGSPEGTGQGPGGTATQMQLRREYLDRFGPRVYGDRRFLVLGIVLAGSVEKVTPTDTALVSTRTITWSELCSWPGHPLADDLQAYFRWKLDHSTMKAARRVAAELANASTT